MERIQNNSFPKNEKHQAHIACRWFQKSVASGFLDIKIVCLG
jgi:hypothetical protein